MSFPTTPPSGEIGNARQKPIPHFELPEQTPKTPRKKQTFLTPRKNSQLKTPKTAEQGKSIFGATPHRAQTLLPPPLPPTPDFTPQRSPRSGRRKRLSVDLLELAGPLEHMGMFLPKNSTVGSGRKSLSPMKSLKAPLALELAEMLRINENLAFEEDFDESILQSPTKKSRGNHGGNPRGRPRGRDARENPAGLQTPGGQIITLEKVQLWHGHSYKNAFSSDEESGGEELVNPFVSGKTSRKPARSVFGAREVDYSTHNEYVNHKTGERKIEPLLESQKKFKPKKIDFLGI